MDYILENLQKQAEFFNSGKTKDVNFRIEQLKKLKNIINLHEKQIIEAAQKDLGRPEFETFSSEIFLCIQEINHAIKNIKNWTNAKKIKTPFYLWPSKSSTIYEPYGQVLIISPWNYPFQLTFSPLIGAISAGNCITIKPSEKSQSCSNLIYKIFSENFESEYINVIQGGVQEAEFLLQQKFDYIFFTGSTKVGRIVMKNAAYHLTPLTLELGGKNPCIVDKNTNIDLAAKKIAWGKFLNAGQSCIATDFLIIHEEVKEDFIKKLIFYIEQFYKNKSDITHIIDKEHFERLINIIKQGKIIYGSNFEFNDLYIQPTIIETHNFIEEEIFGPILPIYAFADEKKLFEILEKINKPLLVYVFTQNKNLINQIIKNTQSGTLCLNDVNIQFTNYNLPFGGLGKSGLGKYHGKKSFEIFSHEKSIFNSKNLFDLRFKDINFAKKLLNWIKK